MLDRATAKKKTGPPPWFNEEFFDKLAGELGQSGGEEDDDEEEEVDGGFSKQYWRHWI